MLRGLTGTRCMHACTWYALCMCTDVHSCRPLQCSSSGEEEEICGPMCTANRREKELEEEEEQGGQGASLKRGPCQSAGVHMHTHTNTHTRMFITENRSSGLPCRAFLSQIVYVTGGQDVTVTSTAASSTISNVRFEVIGYTGLVVDVPDLTVTGIYQSVSESRS